VRQRVPRRFPGSLWGTRQVSLARVRARDADGNWGPALAVWIPAKA
jgi:hypothetical protein